MPEEVVRTRNHLALGLLLFGKALGIVGLVLGMSHRFAGGLLLTLDGFLIVGSIALCVGTSRLQDKVDRGHKAALAEMLREGTLDQLLRDLRAETTPTTPNVARESVATS
jgi:hypothetical protein